MSEHLKQLPSGMGIPPARVSPRTRTNWMPVLMVAAVFAVILAVFFIPTHPPITFDQDYYLISFSTNDERCQDGIRPVVVITYAELEKDADGVPTNPPTQKAGSSERDIRVPPQVLILDKSLPIKTVRWERAKMKKEGLFMEYPYVRYHPERVQRQSKRVLLQ